jgi:hypothetical protein
MPWRETSSGIASLFLPDLAVPPELAACVGFFAALLGIETLSSISPRHDADHLRPEAVFSGRIYENRAAMPGKYLRKHDL